MATTPITSTTTGGSTQGTATSITPKNLLADLLKNDPKIGERLLASYNQAFQQGEASSYNDPGEQFGEYTIKATPGYFSDPAGGGGGAPDYGSVGGFTLYKEEKMPDGKPLQTTLNYDPSGTFLGAEVRQFTGGDSGALFNLDANGQLVGQPQGFDYSESWKGAIAPLVGMAAMAFGMPGGPLANSLAGTLGSKVAANALVAGAFGGAQSALTGGDWVKAALLSGAGAGLGTYASQLAPDVSKYFSDLTGSSDFGNIASGAFKGGMSNLASGDPSKILTGALTGGVKSVDWGSMLGDIFGGGGLDALGGEEGGGFGNLRFNDETGEWYSIGPGESPRDAFGNIIDQSGSGGALNNLINKGVGNLANKAIGSIFGGAGAAGAGTGTGTAAAAEDDSFLTPSFGGGQQIQLASLTPGSEFGDMTSQPAPSTAAAPASNFYNDAAFFDADKYLEPTQGAKAGGLMYAEGGEVEHDPEFYSEGGASIAHRYVRGDGDGTSDSVPAMLATGEFVIPADVVSGLGNGDNDAGAKVLDEFMRTIRVHKRSAKPHQLPEDSKGPLAYMEEAYRKVRT